MIDLSNVLQSVFKESCRVFINYLEIKPSLNLLRASHNLFNTASKGTGWGSKILLIGSNTYVSILYLQIHVGLRTKCWLILYTKFMIICLPGLRTLVIPLIKSGFINISRLLTVWNYTMISAWQLRWTICIFRDIERNIV